MYILACIRDVKLRQSMEVWDQGTIRDRIVKQPIRISGFEGRTLFTIWHINFELTISPMRIWTSSMSLMVVAPPIMCCLGDFGSADIRLFRLPTTFVKVSRRKIRSMCHWFPIQQDAPTSLKSFFFFDIPSWPWGIPPPALEDLEEKKPHLILSRPHPLTLLNHRSNKGQAATTGNLINRSYTRRSAYLTGGLPTPYEVYAVKSLSGVRVHNYESFVGKEANSDGDHAACPFQDRSKDQGKELIRFNLVGEAKKA